MGVEVKFVYTLLLPAVKNKHVADLQLFLPATFAGNAITKCPNSCIPSQLTPTNSPNGDKGIDGELLNDLQQFGGLKVC